MTASATSEVFPSITRGLVELVEWLLEEGVESVAMESTSVYWIPLFELLESKRKQLEHARGAIDFPQDLHQLSPLTSQDQSNLASLDELVVPCDWAWTESFDPTVDGRSQAQFENLHDKYASLARHYIRPV